MALENTSAQSGRVKRYGLDAVPVTQCVPEVQVPESLGPAELRGAKEQGHQPRPGSTWTRIWRHRPCVEWATAADKSNDDVRY